MPSSPTEIAANIGIAMLIVGIAGSASAWWPRAENPHVQTAHTSIPDQPNRQYSFEFRPDRIDSFAWSSVFRDAPDGQIGDLEGVTLAQAATFANAMSKRGGHEACYQLENCGDDPAGENYSCEAIDPAPLSCRGYRMPTARELEMLERTDRRTRFVQWSHEGRLVDNRRVRGNDDNLRELAGFMLVQTTAYDIDESTE